MKGQIDLPPELFNHWSDDKHKEAMKPDQAQLVTYKTWHSYLHLILSYKYLIIKIIMITIIFYNIFIIFYNIFVIYYNTIIIYYLEQELYRPSITIFVILDNWL